MICLICGTVQFDYEPEPCNCLHSASLPVLGEAFDRLRLEIKQREAALELCKLTIRERLARPSVNIVGRWRVEWSKDDRTNLDSKRLKAERPDVWLAYAKTTEVHTVSVKQIEVEEDVDHDAIF
jgi:predicted phage-related endonuclease